MVLGILLLIATGASWVVTGAVVGNAAKHNLPVNTIQAVAALLSILISGTVLLFLPDNACPPAVRIWTVLSLLVSGFFNYFVLEWMGKAMKAGPNGIVWAVIQSALIFPFLVGVTCFGETLTLPRTGGFLAIVAALIFFGAAGDNRTHGGNWRGAAFLGLLVAGVSQVFANLPSFFPEAQSVSSVSRALAVAIGTLVAFFYCKRNTLSLLPGELSSPQLWRFATLLAASVLAAGYFLLYRGLDLVAAAGAGSISYPVIVSSCIVSFTLYSFLILKERMKPLQLVGLALGLTGIVLITG